MDYSYLVITWFVVGLTSQTKVKAKSSYSHLPPLFPRQLVRHECGYQHWQVRSCCPFLMIVVSTPETINEIIELWHLCQHLYVVLIYTRLSSFPLWLYQFSCGGYRYNHFCCVLCTESFRRQRARERQQKLLAEFASRQKSFMETAMDVGKKTPTHQWIFPAMTSTTATTTEIGGLVRSIFKYTCSILY